MVWWAWGCVWPEAVEVVTIAKVDVVRLPHWVVKESSIEADCADGAPDCLRGACVLQSLERAPAEAEVRITVEDGEASVTVPLSVELGAGERREVGAEFEGARSDVENRVRCDLMQPATRVTCAVKNTGQQEHEVELVASLADAAGQPTTEQRGRFRLAPGELRPIAFTFDQGSVNGSCALD